MIRFLLERMKTAHVKLAFPDALRIQSAELWLRLGQPVQALLELEKLTKGDKVAYEAQVQKNGKKSEVVLDAAGKPVKM